MSSLCIFIKQRYQQRIESLKLIVEYYLFLYPAGIVPWPYVMIVIKLLFSKCIKIQFVLGVSVIVSFQPVVAVYHIQCWVMEVVMLSEIPSSPEQMFWLQ